MKGIVDWDGQPASCVTTGEVTVAAAILFDAGGGICAGIGSLAALSAACSSAWRIGSSDLAVEAIDPVPTGRAGIGTSRTDPAGNIGNVAPTCW